MELSKPGNISSISKSIRAYGYDFSGSYTEYSESENSDITTVVWSNNCTCDMKTMKYEYKNGDIFSIYKYGYLEKNPKVIYCEYLISSETDFNLFVQLANEDGFQFAQDEIDGNSISSYYGRINEGESRLEFFIFIELSNELFKIQFHSAPYSIEVPAP